MSHGHRNDGGHGHGGECCGGDLEKPLLGDGAGGGHTEEQGKLKKAVYCALFMMFVEIVGGIVANSLAIITDAAHMLSDVGGFIVSLVCLQLAVQGATQEYTYGFKQAEVLGALLSITIVWALTGILLWEASQRFIEPEEIDGLVMFTISVIGFLVNLGLIKVLGHGHAHGDGGEHGHSHVGHGHGHDDHGDEDASLAMKAAVAHVVGDIVQSLGVCLASLCIWLKPFDLGVTPSGVSNWNYADPMCTILFGILVLFTTKSTLTQTINSLMVKVPKDIDRKALVRKLCQIPKVANIHDLHVWSMGSKDVLCTAHLVVNGADNSTAILNSALQAAKDIGIGHSTFQLEILGEFDPRLEAHGTPCGLEERTTPTGALTTPAGGGGGGGHGGHEHGHGEHGGHVDSN